MSTISDLIEGFINDLIKDEEELELSRNELAVYFSCAPSQINYVLTTRFTEDKGYMISSRRGGGGGIKISKITTNLNFLSELLENISDEISYKKAENILSRLASDNILTKHEFELLSVAITDKALAFPINIKDKLRAKIMKEVILKISCE